MEHTSRTVCVALVCACLGAVGAAQPAPDPLSGRWELNVARTHYGGGADPRRSETFACVRTRTGVDCTIASVRASGSKVDGGFIAEYDGTPGPTRGIADVDQVRLIRVSESIADATFTFRGRPVFAYRAVRSDNRQSLTIISVDPTSRAVLNSVVVYDAKGVAFSDRIAFSSDRDGDEDIFVMNADGSGPVNLTHHRGTDTYPAWSPDCRRITFNSDRDGVMAVYSMRADGGDVRRLTNDGQESLRPDWSPDGRRFAFGRSLDSTHDEIFLINADGSGTVNLSRHPAAYGGPAWSPDGHRLAFHSNRDGDVEIYVMNADGTGLSRLTNSPRADVEPSWSPDGTQVAFASFRNGRPDIYLMHADGRDVRRLTDAPAADYHPAWSPDGKQIAFHTSRDGNDEIYVMDADGTGLRNLTNHPGNDVVPRWCGPRR